MSLTDLFNPRKRPITGIANLAFGGLLIYSLFDWARTLKPWSEVINGHPHFTSLITFSLLFIFMSRKFSRASGSDAWVFGMSMAFLLGLIALYEAFYQFGFVIRDGISSLLNRYGIYDMGVKLTITSVLLVTRPFWRLRGNKAFLLSFLGFAIVFTVWVATGFHQNLQFWEGKWKFLPFNPLVEVFNMVSKTLLFVAGYSLVSQSQVKV